LPNLLHCLDSCIMFGVLDRCHKQQIDIMPIHDAFYVLSGDSNKRFVNKSYADSVLQLFENDPIRILVANNGVDWNCIPLQLRDYYLIRFILKEVIFCFILNRMESWANATIIFHSFLVF